MNEQTRIIYRILEERYVKIAWTHKIQECQSEIHLEEFIKQRNQMGLAAALTSSTAIISLITKCASFIDNKYILLLIPIITAGLSAWSTYLTFRFKDRVLEKKAEENKHFAAKCHDLRNRYESLLGDIKSGIIADSAAMCKLRDELADMENQIYADSATPHTSNKAVKLARSRLLGSYESQTTNEEIRAIVPLHLQIL